MNIAEVMEDSLRYPLLDWKKLIILGIIILFTSMSGIGLIFSLFGVTDISIARFFNIFYLLVYGYLFRVIKSPTWNRELPEFDEWQEMFKDGIKVFIIGFVYSIPAILLILIFAVVPFVSNMGFIGSNMSTVIAILGSTMGIGSLVPILYMIIIMPLLLVGIMNMAYNNNELSAAFRFDEIIDFLIVDKKYFVAWYVVTGISYVVIFLLGSVLFMILGLLIHPLLGQVVSTLTIGQIFTLLIIVPYINIYLARSLSLFINQSPAECIENSEKLTNIIREKILEGRLWKQ
ncbi:MAG TPA: DUF4013 domain-containing protein [Methanobacterium sp.]|nr:DUF4013 domain-containing protein [Methanobacterium sp.]